MLKYLAINLMGITEKWHQQMESRVNWSNNRNETHIEIKLTSK